MREPDVSNPHWMFRSHGQIVARPMRAWYGPEGTVVVVTEQGKGVSITNAAEEVVKALMAEFGSTVEVVEHYPEDTGVIADEHWDLVWVEDDGRPRWRHLPFVELDRLVGTKASR